MVKVGFEIDNFVVTSNALSASEIQDAKVRFESLLGHLPSDSSARLEITDERAPSEHYTRDPEGRAAIHVENEKQWTLDFSIRFAHGHIADRLTGSDLSLLYSKMIAELGRKIGIWQAQRSIDLFSLNHTTEGTFFQQIEMNLKDKSKPGSIKALVIEDDPAAVTVLSTLLENLGVDVVTAEKVADGLDRVSKEKFDMIFLDWNLPYLTGRDFLIEADKLLSKTATQRSGGPLQVTICSGNLEADLDIPPLKELKISGFWHKSTPFSSLLFSVENSVSALRH
jgi:CheY-like chemotaxis protein